MRREFMTTYRARFSVRHVRDDDGRPGGSGRGGRGRRTGGTDAADGIDGTIDVIMRCVHDWLQSAYDGTERGWRPQDGTPPPWARRLWTAWRRGDKPMPSFTVIDATADTRVQVSGEDRRITDDAGRTLQWACRVEERIAVTADDPDSGPRPLPRIRRTDIALTAHAARSPRHSTASTITIRVAYRDETGTIGLPQPEPTPTIPDIAARITADPALVCTHAGVPVQLMDLTVTAPATARDGGTDTEGRDDDVDGGTDTVGKTIDANDLWYVVADRHRDFPIAVIGLDAAGTPLIDPHILHDTLFPDVMICTPDGHRAMQAIRHTFDTHLPGSSPRQNTIRIYAPQPALADHADQGIDADDDPVRMRAAARELGRHHTITGTQITARRTGPDDGADRGDRHDPAVGLLAGLVDDIADGNADGTPDPTVDTIAAIQDHEATLARLAAAERRASAAQAHADKTERRLRDKERALAEQRRQSEHERERHAAAVKRFDDERERLTVSADGLNTANRKLRKDLADERRRTADLTIQLTAVRERLNARESGRTPSDGLDGEPNTTHTGGSDKTDKTGTPGAPTAAGSGNRGTDETESSDHDELLHMALADNTALIEENRRLEDGNDELAHRNAELNHTIERLTHALDAAGQGTGADTAAVLDDVRSLMPADLPQMLATNSRNLNARTAEAIVRLFAALYPDRIRIHESAWRTLRECITRPALVWQGMHLACTAAYDVYAGEPGRGNPSTLFRANPSVGGFELAENEGPQTHRDPSYMRIRQIDDRGRRLTAEPHLRIGSKEDEASLRIYFAWNPDDRHIVIRAVGRHLENYTTRTGKR